MGTGATPLPCEPVGRTGHASLLRRGLIRREAAVAGALVVLTLLGLGLRLHAASGHRARLSTDEHAYVRLAYDLRTHGTYGDPGMANPLHWAPGAPALFALAAHLDPSHALGDASSVGPDRAAQAVVGALTVPVAFGVAALLAGPVAGLLAAGVLAVFPPAVLLSASFLSEPLGGFALALAALGLVWAFRGRAPRFLLAGGLLGLACLARADLLGAALLVPVGVVLATRGRWRADRLLRGAATLAGVLLVLAPWTIYASSRRATWCRSRPGRGRRPSWRPTFPVTGPCSGQAPPARRGVPAAARAVPSAARATTPPLTRSSLPSPPTAARAATQTPCCATRPCATSVATACGTRSPSAGWRPPSCGGCGGPRSTARAGARSPRGSHGSTAPSRSRRCSPSWSPSPAPATAGLRSCWASSSWRRCSTCSSSRRPAPTPGWSPS